MTHKTHTKTPRFILNLTEDATLARLDRKGIKSPPRDRWGVLIQVPETA